MKEEFTVIVHSCIKITGEQTVYFDPFRLSQETKDADIIFVTHEHYDHYSPEDIAKVRNASTILVCPESMEMVLNNSGFEKDFIELVKPGDELEINNIKIEAVPSYNVNKEFHKRSANWVGYVITMNGKRYYVAGDTDINEDVEKVSCDVAFLPVGGKYTTNVEEAAELALKINPKLAVPTHYGKDTGLVKDGERFAELLKGKLETKVFEI